MSQAVAQKTRRLLVKAGVPGEIIERSSDGWALIVGYNLRPLRGTEIDATICDMIMDGELEVDSDSDQHTRYRAS